MPFLSMLPSIVTRAPLPEDIDSVVSIDRKQEIDPREVGLSPTAAEEIWDSALHWYRTGIHPAISICIRVRGQVVMRRSVGYAHGGGPEEPPGTARVKVTPETPFNVFSASKPMAAMVIHLLDQRNLLHLDDAVCEYIPEFSGYGKEWVTIRHVLTHRAGIPVIPEEALDIGILEDLDNREAIRLLCEARPVSRPGGRLAYHAVTGGFLIGEIVRAVTGKNIRAVVEDEFCRRFGWRWMNYGVKRKDVEKVAASYFTGLPMVPPLGAIVRRVLGLDFVEAVASSNDPRYLMGVLPAANLIATADELSQFYQMLLNGGELNGERLFEARTVCRATSEQSYGELDFTLGVPLRYGMGFMLGGEWFSLYGFDSAHAFGHLGLTNIFAWADPQRHLSAAIMTSGKPVLYPEMHRGLMLIHSITSSCPKDLSVPPRPRGEPRERKRSKAAKRGAKAALKKKAGRGAAEAPASRKVKKSKARRAKAAKKKSSAQRSAPKDAAAVVEFAEAKSSRAAKPSKKARRLKPR